MTSPTTDLSCWELLGPASSLPRPPRVTSGASSIPGDVSSGSVVPMPNDIHVNTSTGGSAVYDGFKWQTLSGGDVYWGYGTAGPASRPADAPPLVDGEASADFSAGALHLYRDGAWSPVDGSSVPPGSEYVDLATGDVYALSAS